MYYVSLHLLLSYCVHAFHSQHGTTTTATGLRLNLATTSSPSSHGTVPAKAGEKRKVGIIIVDHGSRLAASNSRLLQVRHSFPFSDLVLFQSNHIQPLLNIPSLWIHCEASTKQTLPAVQEKTSWRSRRHTWS